MRKMNCNASAGAVYGIGMIGVLIYYLQSAKNLVDVSLGIFKSIVWPAILTYKLFGFLKL